MRTNTFQLINNNIMKGLISTMVMFFLITACKKPKTPVHRIENETIHKALEIKKGSYFIFKDSVSGEIDSAYVYEQTSVLFLYAQDVGDFYAEVLSYFLQFNSFKLLIWSPMSNNWPSSNYAILSVYTNDTNYYEPLLTLSTPHEKMYSDSNVAFEWHQVNHFDTLMIRGKPYMDVYECASKKKDNTFNWHSYYSVESGLVKYSIEQDGSKKVWEIERNQIIR